MNCIRDAAEIDVHDAVQLTERFSGTIPPQAALDFGIRDHQVERRIPVDTVNPGGDRRCLGNIEASLGYRGTAFAAAPGHGSEPRSVSAAECQASSGHGVGPSQSSAYTAARTRDENAVGIPHPVNVPASTART